MSQNQPDQPAPQPNVPRHPTELDLARNNYHSLASNVFANVLRHMYEPNAEDNPVPAPGVPCYTGEKLPPLLTGLYDGDAGYGAPVNELTEFYQRRTAQASYNAIVSWVNSHSDSPKKRQNMINEIMRVFMVGKSVLNTMPINADEDTDDYIARINTRITPVQAPVEQEEELPKVSKKPKSKESKESEKKSEPEPAKKPEPTKKPEPKKSGKVVKGQKVLESDSESIADNLNDDSNDSNEPISESSDIDIDDSESSEMPVKKPTAKRAVGRPARR